MPEQLKEIEPMSATTPPNGNGRRGGATTIPSINPVTGEKLGEVPLTLPEAAGDVMATARTAQPAWGKQPLKARIEIVRKMRNLLYYRRDELVDLLVRELGKVPHEARFEIIQQLLAVDYLTKQAPKVYKPRREFVSLLPHRRHYISYQPRGVVLVITPWNFPVVLALDSIVPALLGGNAIIYKPSEYTPLVGEFVAQLAVEAGVPEGVFQIVHGYGDTGQSLIDARPDMVAFTGSVAVGRKVAAQAGELLIPVILELGGNDAAIVLEDANIDRTARGLVWAGTMHAGQMCISVERIFVVEAVADKLVGAMRKAVKQFVKPGLSVDPAATHGPITVERQAELIRKQVEDATEKGAKVYQDAPLNEALGGTKGQFYPPTIITDVPSDAVVLHEETFGPVMVVVTVKDEDAAIEQANNTHFGLSASIWTGNRKRGERIANQLQAGMTSINDHAISISAPQLPWGGMKYSGYGRSRGREGLQAMVIPQTHSYERFPIGIEVFWYPYNRLKRQFVKRLIPIWFGPTITERIKGFLPWSDV
jgi:acyl-CoA reductase-like NAD-dependent aldehyde dehydrogenase